MDPLDDMGTSVMAFAALTRLARPGLLTAPASPTDEIATASQAEVEALMIGGGTLDVDSATALLHHSGFTEVSTLQMQASTIMLASVG